MNNSFRLLLTFFYICLILSPAFSGSLFVGQKIIYGGGADSSPQEKDAGVKFEADIKSTANMSDMEEDSNYKTAVKALKDKDLQKASAFLICRWIFMKKELKVTKELYLNGLIQKLKCVIIMKQLIDWKNIFRNFLKMTVFWKNYSKK